ncbi:hypothetical protein OZX65_02290 [Leuconostocaceae bacterium ESL0723]|nr:hypothetical protein OZX65_02290 [Leuconostocaceae bacterium ESL0723]
MLAPKRFDSSHAYIIYQTGPKDKQAAARPLRYNVAMLKLTEIKTHPLRDLGASNQHLADLLVPDFEAQNPKSLANFVSHSFDLGAVESVRWQKNNQRLKIIYENDAGRHELLAKITTD